MTIPQPIALIQSNIDKLFLTISTASSMYKTPQISIHHSAMQLVVPVCRTQIAPVLLHRTNRFRNLTIANQRYQQDEKMSRLKNMNASQTLRMTLVYCQLSQL